MDSFFMYAITLVTLPVSLLLIFFIHKNGKGSLNIPPGSTFLPLIGETISFALFGSEKFVSDRMKKYSGDVFKTSLLGENMAILCGPQGNKFIFSNETTWWPQSMKRILHSTEIVENLSVDVVGLSRSFLQDFLKPESLKLYIPKMDMMAKQHIQKEWAPYQEVKVFPLSKKYTFYIACKLFINVADPAQIKMLADSFHLMANGMSFFLPIDLPGTAYSAAIKGRNMVREELLKIIRERRKVNASSSSSRCEDLLSRILIATNENGEFYGENEIAAIIIGLLVGSHETTSSTVTFVVKHLAQYPHIYNQVLTEQNEIAKGKGPDDLLTWKDVEKMKYSWNVVRESLRVTPAALGAFRETTTDSVYAGFTIPKGWKTFWNVHTTHNNPKYFPDPEKFDPTRFEGSGPVPYTFVAFGGGPRMCPGIEYARLEILIFMHNIVRRFKFEHTIPNEKIAFRAFPVPVKGLPVRLHPSGMQSVHEP